MQTKNPVETDSNPRIEISNKKSVVETANKAPSTILLDLTQVFCAVIYTSLRDKQIETT